LRIDASSRALVAKGSSSAAYAGGKTSSVAAMTTALQQRVLHRGRTTRVRQAKWFSSD
jgi:hypothetical protein